MSVQRIEVTWSDCEFLIECQSSQDGSSGASSLSLAQLGLLQHEMASKKQSRTAKLNNIIWSKTGDRWLQVIEGT